MPFLAVPIVIAGISTTVGTAAAVSAGVIGTVMSVAAKITKNKLLGKIGMGFGIAGAVIGVGTLAAGAGMFGNTVSAGASASGAGSGAGSAALPAAAVTPGSTVTQGNLMSAVGGGIGQTAPSAGAVVPTGSLAAVQQAGAVGSDVLGGAGAAQSLDVAGSIAGTGPGGFAAAPGAGVLAPTAAPIGAGSVLAPATGLEAGGLGGLPGSTTPSLQSLGAGAPIQGSGAAGTGLESSALSAAGPAPSASWIQTIKETLGNLTPSGVGPWWNSLDATTKGLLINTAGQGTAGAVGGIFSSIQSDTQMELMKQINAENRAHVRWQSQQSPGLIQFHGAAAPQAPQTPGM